MSPNPYTGSRTGDTDRRRIFNLLTEGGYAATEKNVEFIIEKYYSSQSDTQIQWTIDTYRFSLPDKK